MKSGGIDAGDVITILVYVLIFGGAIVAEIVKHLKKKQAEEVSRRQRREERDILSKRMAGEYSSPQELETREEEQYEEEVEEMAPSGEEYASEGEGAPTEPAMPELSDSRRLFEEIFGPLPRGEKQEGETISEEQPQEPTPQEELSKLKEKVREVVTRHELAKQASAPPHPENEVTDFSLEAASPTLTAQVKSQSESIENRIFKGRHFTDKQRIIIMAELIGRPRARKLHSRN